MDVKDFTELGIEKIQEFSQINVSALSNDNLFFAVFLPQHIQYSL